MNIERLCAGLGGCILLHALLCATVAGRAQAPLSAAADDPYRSVTVHGRRSTISAADNPVADQNAEVIFGHARFTVLTPELVRMEWSANGRFEDHASFVFINRRLEVPKFQKTLDSSHAMLTITTSALTLRYAPSGDGHFTSGSLSISLTVEGKQVVWHPGLVDSENLQGTTRTLDGARGSQTKEPMEPGLISRSGWAIVDDSTRPLFDSADFRFLEGEKSPWPWVMERPESEKPGSYADWYFFGYGHDYRKALGDFVRIAGRIPLPPRFAFGVWWSRYWAYPDQELNDLVHGFRENDTPLSVLVIDMDWHISADQLRAMGETDQSGQRLGWSGYTWNNVLFPDPDAFLKNLHEEGLKTTLNLHPASGIQPWEQAYPAMARAMGIDPATKKYVPFDPTDKRWATAYFQLVLHPLEKQGVDFWWLDWQQQQYTSLPNVTPTWWLNYLHFTDQQREGKRPLLFHRWGGLGNHRYQIGFSGDTISVWDSLAFQPWFTATASNVGYAYWSHDIGGHMPGAVDPELYTRWVQFGAFSPILRTHTTKNPDAERRIWAYPEPYSAVLRSAFQLRVAIQPYLYTEARRTYDTGVAFFHPLYYDWPEDDPAYTTKNEYVFGQEMLAAPVTTQADPVSGLATEKVWLPTGNWIEWPTGSHLTGPTLVNRSFSIGEIPVYLREGAIVPMQPPLRKAADPLILNIWPLAPGKSSSYSVYEDSGVSVQYQQGVFARTPIKASQTGDALRIAIGPVEGNYAGMAKVRAYEIHLPDDWPPASVKVNGVPVKKVVTPRGSGWSFEGNTLTTIIPVPSGSATAQVLVEVQRASGLIGRRGELDGFAGAMTRLRGVYDCLQQTIPITSAPDSLIHVMQTGDRLSYHPEQAAKEISDFGATLPQAERAVADVAAEFDRRINDSTRHVGGSDQVTGNPTQERERRIAAMRRGQALMEEDLTGTRQQNDKHEQKR